jgi:hypothetical protein
VQKEMTQRLANSWRALFPLQFMIAVCLLTQL